jgi:hypothetical protein
MRIHKRADFPMVATRRVSAVLKALLRRYVRDNGPESLLPQRKAPLHSGLLRAIFAIPNGVALGNRILCWTDPFFVSVKALLCMGLAGGFRKTEMSNPNALVADGKPLPKGRTPRTALKWRIGGKFYSALSVALSVTLTGGDFALITPFPTKNDQFGDVFGVNPVWFPYDIGEPTNAAAALAALELACPVSAALRRSVALFPVDVALSPMTHSVIDSTLHMLLLCIMSAAAAAAYSVHSLRIACATALLEQGASHPQIQAFCRWQTLESVALYARMGPELYTKYAKWIARAEPAAVTAMQLPTIDDDVFVAELHESDVSAALGVADAIGHVSDVSGDAPVGGGL